jgi:hypothetical protein
MATLASAGCKRLEPRKLDPVSAIRSHVELRFQPPADGLLTNAQLDMYLRVRRAAGSGSDAETALQLGIDPFEFVWVRARIVEAIVALDSRQVAEAALESYARAIATVREARRSARDAQTAARLDGEIAGLERERSTLRKGEGPTPQMVRNAARVAPRRAEIESLGP